MCAKEGQDVKCRHKDGRESTEIYKPLFDPIGRCRIRNILSVVKLT